MFNTTHIKKLLLRHGFVRAFNRRFAFLQKPSYNAEPQNKDRRRLLKLAALASASAVIGKIAGDKLLSSFSKDFEVGQTSGFKIKEEGNKLVFYNQRGNKLFTLSDDGEMEIGD